MKLKSGKTVDIGDVVAYESFNGNQHLSPPKNGFSGIVVDYVYDATGRSDPVAIRVLPLQVLSKDFRPTRNPDQFLIALDAHKKDMGLSTNWLHVVLNRVISVPLTEEYTGQKNGRILVRGKVPETTYGNEEAPLSKKLFEHFKGLRETGRLNLDPFIGGHPGKKIRTQAGHVEKNATGLLQSNEGIAEVRRVIRDPTKRRAGASVLKPQVHDILLDKLVEFGDLDPLVVDILNTKMRGYTAPQTIKEALTLLQERNAALLVKLVQTHVKNLAPQPDIDFLKLEEEYGGHFGLLSKEFQKKVGTDLSKITPPQTMDALIDLVRNRPDELLKFKGIGPRVQGRIEQDVQEIFEVAALSVTNESELLERLKSAIKSANAAFMDKYYM